MATLLARRGVERRDAGEAGKLGIASEAADTAGLADDLGGDEHATALQLEQLRRVVGDEHRDLALELVRLPRQLTAVPHQVASDPHLDVLLSAREAAPDALEPDHAIERAGRHAQVRLDRVQEPAEAILRLASLARTSVSR